MPKKRKKSAMWFTARQIKSYHFPIIVSVLALLIALPLTIFINSEQHILKQNAQINIIKSPPQDSCGLTTYSFAENTSCPRLTQWPSCSVPNPSQKNNVSTYTFHVHVASMDGKPHKVSMEYLPSVCQKGLSHVGTGNSSCSCFVYNPSNDGFVVNTTPFDFDITRSSGQGACGTYQYDIFVNSVDSNNQCRWGDTYNAGVAGYCETGNDCPNPIPSQPPDPNTKVSEINNSSFSPSTMTIPAGGTVGWNNVDSASHTVTSDSQTGSDSWDSGTIQSHQGFARVFAIPGQYGYHDSMHPNLKGTISVVGSASPTFTPTPTTASTTPTNTLTPNPTSGTVNVNFTSTVLLHGLGKGGDNVNPSSGGNASPAHATRNLTITVFDANNNIVKTQQGNVNYDATSGTFTGTKDMGAMAAGVYLVALNVDGFLQRQLPGIVTMTGSTQNVMLPQITLVSGNINNDDQIDILDYNILIGCFGSKANTASCTAPPTSASPGADISDDGVVDGIDYNLFLRELSVQRGQ